MSKKHGRNWNLPMVMKKLQITRHKLVKYIVATEKDIVCKKILYQQCEERKKNEISSKDKEKNNL